MKRIITLLFLLTPFFMVKAQVLNIENGVLFSNTKFKANDVCNHTNHAVFLSFDYFKIKKSFYITTQVGYFASGYYAYQYNYFGHLKENLKFKSREMHFSLSFRGKLPVGKNLFLYAGLGPKLDYSFDYKKKIEDHSVPNLNMFRNMFGGKFDLGVYKDIQKYMIGFNTAYLTNFGNGGDFYTNRFVCSISVGYIFEKPAKK